MMKFQVYLLVAIVWQFPGLVFSHNELPESKSSIKLRLMSFNIRNGRAKDGNNQWENRKNFVCDVIRDASLDVVGLQEAFHFQLEHMKEKLPQFSVVGEGRDGGKKGEYSAILFRSQRFALKDSGTFWLSNTPEKKSKSWGNRYLRVCTWAYLIDQRTSRSFYVYNTHLDHQSQNARFQSAKLIARRISQRKYPDPFCLMGDFNASEDNEVVVYLKGKNISSESEKSPVQLEDTFRRLHPAAKDVGTGGGFEGRRNGPKIDYIFVPKGVKTTDASIVIEQRDGKYPSDHFPVFAQILFPISGP
ncbi:MAG: endonuclease/exonuclease/phosphatase family protein [Planctomycetota bacterium]|nr:endonuclease/exonuclease/phosphatase family protein [Planctomycetota bacterium]